MKVARFVLKIVAVSLVVAAAVCAVIAYWDKIVDASLALYSKVKEKKSCICKSEYEDYVEQ